MNEPKRKRKSYEQNKMNKEKKVFRKKNKRNKQTKRHLYRKPIHRQACVAR